MVGASLIEFKVSPSGGGGMVSSGHTKKRLLCLMVSLFAKDKCFMLIHLGVDSPKKWTHINGIWVCVDVSRTHPTFSDWFGVFTKTVVPTLKSAIV